MFVFWCGGNGSPLDYAGSSNGGANWTTTILAGTDCVTGSGNSVNIWYDGSLYVYITDYFGSDCGSDGNHVCLKVGTVTGPAGTIGFGAWQAIPTGLTGNSISAVSLVADTFGSVWLASTNSTVPTDVSLTKCVCAGGGSWSTAPGYPQIFNGGGADVALLALDNSNMALLYQNPSGCQPNCGVVNLKIWNGTGFRTVASTSKPLFDGYAFSSVAMAGGNVGIVFDENNTRNIWADIYQYATNNWQSPTLLDDRSGLPGGKIDPVLSYDQPTQSLYAFWSHGQGTIWYAVYQGGSWSQSTTFVTGEQNFQAVTNNLGAGYYTALTSPTSDLVPVVWEAGVSPYTIRYAGLLVSGPGTGFNNNNPLPPAFSIPLAAIVQYFADLFFNNLSGTIVLGWIVFIVGVSTYSLYGRRKRRSRKSFTLDRPVKTRKREVVV